MTKLLKLSDLTNNRKEGRGGVVRCEQTKEGSRETQEGKRTLSI